MKRILILHTILLIACIFASCDNQTRIQHGSVEDNITNIIEFDYKNHSYIFFERGMGYYSRGGVVHDPNCKCFQDSVK